MDPWGIALLAAVMITGLVGVVVPVLPGLALVWGATLLWALLEDGAARWVVLAMTTLLLIAGTVVKYVLPTRSAAARGAPASSLLLAAVGAGIGFFVVPVVGVVVGGLGVLLLAERGRLGDWGAAWASTRAALVALGVGVLVEFVAGVAIIATWSVGVAVTWA